MLTDIIVVVKKTFRYSNVFSYNHLYQPERFYEKRYKKKLSLIQAVASSVREPYLRWKTGVV